MGTAKAPGEDLFAGPGEACSLGRSVDWASTPLGAVERWPDVLRALVPACLVSPAPMAIWAGEEFVLVHNDAYAAVLGGKHGWAMGQPLREVWAEVYPAIVGEFRQVFREGRAFRHEDTPYVLRRSGREERAFFTFTLSPIRGGDGRVVAVLNVCEETTPRVRALERTETVIRESEARLSALVEQLPVAVGVLDMEARFVIGNSQLRSLGLLRGLPSRDPELQKAWSALDETGRPIPPDQWPAARALRGDPVDEGMEFVHRADDGRTRHTVVSAVPLRGDDGAQVGVILVIQDVSRLKEAEAELRAANQQKAQFLAMLSHELRNPLAPIRNGLYLLERVPPDSPQAARAREVLNRQALHLTRLVDDLLDVTRISRGKVELQRSRLDLRDVAKKTTGDLRSLFDDRGISLRVEQAAEPMWVDGDAVRLAQVLTNLLQNAAKFTPSGGAVTVSLSAADGAARIAVRDTGEGIDPADIDRMFEPFAQGAQGMARTRGGLGLGLALVKGYVELHGGTVAASSAGAGLGAEFVIHLPLAGDRAEAEVPAAPGEATPAREVLIIEDNVDAGSTLADVVRLQGHRVRVALDGRTGLKLLRERAADVVLCDVGLPDMSGYDVARAVRADRTLEGIQLVALTGYAQAEDRRQALEAGFDAHVPKPPTWERIEDLLRDVPRASGRRPP